MYYETCISLNNRMMECQDYLALPLTPLPQGTPGLLWSHMFDNDAVLKPHNYSQLNDNLHSYLLVTETSALTGTHSLHWSEFCILLGFSKDAI